MCGQLISFFYQLYYNFISLIGLKITLALCLLLSILHKRIPCKHNVFDNLIPVDMLFLSYITSLTSPKTPLALLFSTQKWNFIFTLSLAKTGAAGSSASPAWHVRNSFKIYSKYSDSIYLCCCVVFWLENLSGYV